ncbi:MAG: T9SS type A sorting domain-containing protein [Bacteroidia bacterium]
MKLNVPIQQRLKVVGLLFLFGMSCTMLQAQAPLVKQWDKRFGGTSREFLFSFQQTKDGGFILGGWSDSGVGGDKTQSCYGSYDYWVVKINKFGIKEWDKRFGYANDDLLSSICETSDGGYLIAGNSASNAGGDKTENCKGIVDNWLVKIDSVGNKQWDKTIGGNADDDYPQVVQTKDKGYLIGCSSQSGISGDKTQACLGVYDFWIIKTDSLGNVLWDKVIGGTGDDRFWSLKETHDNCFLLGGTSDSPIGFDKSQPSQGYHDDWIVKIDSIGNKIWDRRFGGSYSDVINDLIITNDNCFLLGGSSGSGSSGDKTQPSFGNTDFWILKVDSNGNKVWDKTFGGSESEGSSEFGYVRQTNDSGYLISGASFSDSSGVKSENNLGFIQPWIVKIDSSGNVQWDKTLLYLNDSLGYPYYEKSIGIQMSNGCYAVASFTNADISGYKTQPNWDTTTTFHPTPDFWICVLCDSTNINSTQINLASSDTTFCEKHCIDFYDLSTNNPTSWQWFFPGADSTTSTLQNPTNICYNNYGSFDVTLIACNAAGCDTLLLPGFINEYQTLTPTITQSNDSLFSSPGVAYQWWSVDSGIIAGANNYYYIPAQGGSYYVIVTDTTGCEGASNTIVVMGINELAIGNWQLAIVPNPNNGSFTITLNALDANDFSLRIIDPLGRTVYTENGRLIKQTTSNINVEMGNAAKGLYEVELITNKNVYRQKFLKE